MAVNVAGNEPPHVETGGIIGPPVVVLPVVPMPPVVVSPVVVLPPVAPVIVVPPAPPVGAAPVRVPSSIEQPCEKARSPSAQRLAPKVNAALAPISTSIAVFNRSRNV